MGAFGMPNRCGRSKTTRSKTRRTLLELFETLGPVPEIPHLPRNFTLHASIGKTRWPPDAIMRVVDLFVLGGRRPDEGAAER
jgi:hypothetical protein